MSTSLPKIKFIQDNSQSGSQKQLKFKKIKLTTDTSAADIRERFKSVRTQRLSSLQRYSTVQGQRQYKKEKIHLNLLERKLLTGTYDETKETGNDLNELKQKTDNYKIMSIQRQSQTQKIKQLIQQAKKQIQKYEIQKREKEQAVQKIHKRYDQQRIKTETSASQRNCLQHMINQQKTINHFLQGRINQDKTYLGKLKAIVKQVQNQARQSTQYMKNLQLNASKLNNQMLREQRNREQIMYQKQYIINKRKEGEKVRVQKSNQFKKNLDEVELQIQKKDFMEYYNGILGNIFLRKFNQSSLEFLQKKYQVMQNSYNKICTYNKFKREQPIKMIDRLKQLKPQTLQLEQKIAQLQKRQGELEEKNKQLQKKSSQIRLISKIPVTSTEIRKIPVSKEINEQSRQHEQKEQQKKIEKLKGEILHTTQLLFKIDKWSQRYAKQFQLKIRRKPQETGMNINNILKCVQKDYGELKEKKVLASSQKKQELVG